MPLSPGVEPRRSDFLSDALSTQVRVVSAGILAFCWAFIVADYSSDKVAVIETEAVIPCLFLLVAAVMCDFWQYLIGYVHNREMLKRMRAEKLAQLSYDRRDIRYRARLQLFYAKICFFIAGTMYLLTIVAMEMGGRL